MITQYKLINKILILVVALVISQSCLVDLEEDTSSILILEELKSEEDVIAALTPIYRAFENMAYGPHVYQIIGYGGDDITTWWAGNKYPLRVFDKFDYGDGENSDIDWLSDPWNAYWKMIYYSNMLIDGLKTSPAPSDVVALGDGEARFLRAFAYLNLVKGWGNMPVVLDGMELTGEETRASVLDNYNHIEADLKIAETELPEPGEVWAPGRASKAAAKAALADLYLTWAGWPLKDNSKYQMAAAKAKEIIDMNYFELLPIGELWKLENQNSKESLFAVQFSKTEEIRSNWPAAVNFHESRGWSDMYPELQFFYDFPEGPRKDMTFQTEIPQRRYINGAITDRDPPTKPWQQSQRKHPAFKKWAISADFTFLDRTYGFRAQEMYRYAEILLIYAEASAHASGSATGAAVEAYNQVRRRAAGLPFNQSNSSVDVSSATVDEIVQEKAWELCGEAKRWHDLVRLEKVNDVIAKRDPSENVELVKSSVTWKQYIAPIPFSTISTSNLKQNPEGFMATP